MLERRSVRTMLFGLAVLASVAGWATEPPDLLNYQGVLRDAGGAPLAGSFDMVFRFFDDPVVGTEMLADQHVGAGAVTVSGGLFSAELGGGIIVPLTASSLAELFGDHAAVYMQIDVEGEALAPRIRILSSGFALNSDSLDGRDAAEFLDTSSNQVKTGDLTLDGTEGGGDLVVSNGGSILLDGGGSSLLQGPSPCALKVEAGCKLQVRGGGTSNLEVFDGSKLMVTGDGRGQAGVEVDGAVVTVSAKRGAASLQVQDGATLGVTDGAVVMDGSAVTVSANRGAASLTVQDGATLGVTDGAVVLDGSAVTVSAKRGAASLTVQDGAILGVTDGAVLMDGSAVTVSAKRGAASLKVQDGATLGVTDGAVVMDGSVVMVTAKRGAASLKVDGGATLEVAGGGDVLMNGSDVTITAPPGGKGSLKVDGGANLEVRGGGDIVVKGVAGQSAPLQQWQDSNGVALASVSASGGFSGNGSALASLDASNLASGTLPSARLAGTYSGNVGFSNAGNTFVGNGAGLTSLNASNLSSGTLASARLSGTYSNQLILSNVANSFTGNGAGLTNIRADYALKVNERRVAVVVTGLQSGGPVPGSAFYTSPAAALADLGTWCGPPSQTSPCLIKIMPGSYTLMSPLQMIQWVDIEGSGENATRLVCNTPVVGAPNSVLSFVTLVGPGGVGEYAATLPAGTLRHVSVVALALRGPLVELSGGGALEDVSIANVGGPAAVIISSGSPRLTNARISATDGDAIFIGVGVSPSLTDVAINVGGNVPGTGVRGIVNNGAPTLNNIVITGSSSGILKGISNLNSASSQMNNVVIRLSGQGTPTGVENLESSAIIDNSVIEVATTGGAVAWGVALGHSTVEMRHVTVRATGSNPSAGTGVMMAITPSDSVAKIDNCVISSSGTAVTKNGGSTLAVGATKLDAPVTISGAGSPPFPTCVFSYNGNYLPLNSSCQ